jgi:hypothetical protein
LTNGQSISFEQSSCPGESKLPASSRFVGIAKLIT